MRIFIRDLDEGGHVAYLAVNGPDPTTNVRWRSSFSLATRDEAYRVAVTVARLEFGVDPDELAS